MSHRGSGGWSEGRWFRILQPDGTLWMETSDGEEARLEGLKQGWPVERLWKREEWEWRKDK